MNNKSKHTNRLVNEKSPYLLQHAHNPVDWYPWGEEAFSKARNEDKPIFLSIGYSTCHWCHVMEHESFEDENVAQLLNKTFVSIKVDREERPDIDNIYMTVCQMMTSHGGWPLSVVMTPDKKPFFAGTYFPKVSKYGRIGFVDLINRINDVWMHDRNKILESSNNITNALLEFQQSESERVELSSSELNETFSYFNKRFDKEFGGFGTAPKFPSPHNLMFLLRYWKRTGNNESLNIVTKTLREMRKGGIFDHLGKGFHRYSTDQEWLVPHFEKMLYDQAMLAHAYIESYQVTGEKFYADVTNEIFEYVLRDMTNPTGGFYSAEDADSEGVEGKFYVWSIKEIKEILNEDDSKLFIDVFNLTDDGNFEDESTKTRNGSNIPHLQNDLTEIARRFKISLSDLKSKLETIREKLFIEREKRIHPLKDDKILTDWNSLLISSLAKAGRVLQNVNYIKESEKAIRFIKDNLITNDNLLLHRYRDGEAAITAKLDDYAFLIWALLELYESTFKVDYLEMAVKLQGQQNELFWDNDLIGYFMTAVTEKDLLIRPKEIYDGAIPSGNSVSFMNLIKLGKITANPDYSELAKKQLNAFSDKVKSSLPGSTMFLSALDFDLGPSTEIILVGDPFDKESSELLELINSMFIPNKVVIQKNKSNSDELEKIANYTSSYNQLEDKLTVYVCENYNCKLPVNSIEDLKGILKK
jgi:uncharacterized protein YyaL (SSP411 family)